MAQEVMEKVVSIDARNNNNKKECYSIGSIVFSTPAEDPNYNIILSKHSFLDPVDSE